MLRLTHIASAGPIGARLTTSDPLLLRAVPRRVGGVHRNGDRCGDKPHGCPASYGVAFTHSAARESDGSGERDD